MDRLNRPLICSSGEESIRVVDSYQHYASRILLENGGLDMKLSPIEKKHWTMGLVEDAQGNIIECAICNDGLLYCFEYDDIAHLLKSYPYNPRHRVWYFNSTRDREIAETDVSYDRKITVKINPSFVTTHFVARAF